MPLTDIEIDAAVPVDGTPSRALTNAALKELVVDVANVSVDKQIVDVADGETIQFGKFNRIADGATATVPVATGNLNESFGVWLAEGGTAGALSGGLTLTLDIVREAKTFASDGTAWLEYFGPEAPSVASSTPNVVRLTGGSEAPTPSAYNDAIVIIDSGTQILTAPVVGTEVYYFRGINKSANTATIGGVSIPQNEVFSVLVDGTDMTARNVW